MYLWLFVLFYFCLFALKSAIYIYQNEYRNNPKHKGYLLHDDFELDASLLLS